MGGGIHGALSGCGSGAAPGQCGRSIFVGAVAGGVAGAAFGAVASLGGGAVSGLAGLGRSIAAGAAGGASYSATEQYLSTGHVDWGQVAEAGAVGGVAAGIFEGIGAGVDRLRSAVTSGQGPQPPPGAAPADPYAFRAETNAIVKYDSDFALGQLISGGQARASELIEFADSQGWKQIQSPGGPIKYVDENGVERLVIKRGSPRTPGSETPHVSIRNEDGERVDPQGNPVSRRSPGNHTPIEWDLQD